MSMIRSQQGKTGTTKSFKELEIRIFVEKSDKGNDEVEGNSRKTCGRLQVDIQEET